MLDGAPLEAMGDNSRYTAGAFRFAYENKKQVFALLKVYQDKRLAKSNFGVYSTKQFLQEINNYQGNQQKQEILVKNSYTTLAGYKNKA